MRWGWSASLLLVSGCVWISTDREAERLDQDADGVPLPVDCNDADAGVSTLSSSLPTGAGPDDPVAPDTGSPGRPPDTSDTGGTGHTGELGGPPPDRPSDTTPSGTSLSCDSSILEALNITCDDADPRLICADREPGDYRADSTLDVLPCRHPGFTDRLVQVGSLQNIHRLEVSEPVDVVVTVGFDSSIFQDGTSQFETHPYAAVLANEGRACSEATCALGTPLLDAQEVPEEPVTVSFTALPGSPWYVVVSGSSGSYSLDVRCGEAEL